MGGGNEPWWAIAGGALVSLVMLVATAYYMVRRKHTDAIAGDRKQRADEEDEVRRKAAAEAWELNRRLMEVITGYDGKYASLEQKFDMALRRCEEERRKCEIECAEMCGRLTVIEAWARKKGMVLDPLPGDS